MGVSAGGIFGSYSTVSARATNCYSTGTLGEDAGGIFGFGSLGVGKDENSGHTTGWSDASAMTYLTGTPSGVGSGTTWRSTVANNPYTLVSFPPTTTTTIAPTTIAPTTQATTTRPTVNVTASFDGVLRDNTNYVMSQSIINLTTEFSLAAGNNGTGITWDGNGFTITVTKAGWLGLFPCAVFVRNLDILSNNTTAEDAGWFFRTTIGGNAGNCSSTGDIGGYGGGGIFGSESSGTATNCYSTGTIGDGAGGIFGRESNGTAITCYSTGAIEGGGIFGSFSLGTATNCYSTGNIGESGGGMFGDQTSGTATN
jgi:hypothetical protein